MSTKDIGEKSFSELERIEDKYIITIEQAALIQKEVEKYLKPAYPDPKTEYVLINTLYLDSPDMAFFKYHAYQMKERLKVRIRKYGPNGKWDNEHYFLEIKEKDHDDVKKYRIQLDDENLKKVRKGLNLEFNSELDELNSPLYTHTDLKRYIEKYNKIVIKNEITPVLAVTYKRLAYGKGNALRVTMDNNLSYKSERVMPLSQAYKIKKAVDWKDVKEYGKKYDPKVNVILEVKHNNNLPPWLTKILEENKLEPEKFSKYIWSSFNMIKSIVGED